MKSLLSGPRSFGKRSLMDRFIDGIELSAAFFVGIVALDIFVSVLLRYFFAVVALEVGGCEQVGHERGDI
ncbi:MAG TPA: hypothetical protein VHU22_04925, partial [Xanthobacteraceae bacterium]|nr:hypothetical protein [Xanthobacteraceae bacterium]